MKRFFRGVVLAIALIFAVPVVMPQCNLTTVQAATIKLNCTRKTLYEGDSFKLKVKGTKKKVKWSSSDEWVADVDSDGTVNCFLEGRATIMAKVAGRTLKCRIVVKENEDYSDGDSSNAGNDVAKSTNTASENIAVLKKYIKNNGDVNSNGDRFIYEDTSGVRSAILYRESTDTLSFVLASENTFACTMDMVSSSNTETMQIQFAYADGDGFAFTGTGYIYPYSYSRYTDTTFTIQPSLFQDYSKVQNVCKSAVKTAFSGWDLLLYDNLGIWMKDIGFAKYN